jgi:hypothetical protein
VQRNPDPTQGQARLAKSQKVSVSVRIVLSSGETHQSSLRRQGIAKAENEFMSWGSLQKRESFPLARVLGVPREGAGVQEFVALCSLVADFQAVVATTWRFRFLWFDFHLY